VEVARFDVYLVILDPTIGSEIRKTRPCVIISPDEMNRHLRTVIVAPMTTARRSYPSRVETRFQDREGQIVVDQLRTIDTSRLARRLGRLSAGEADAVLQVLLEIFAP
jgi:mRNA interferase MazF